MGPLTHYLERAVTIQAPPEIVFRYFTDSARWAQWWGAGSTIDARVGGKMLIRYPNGVETLGEVLEVLPPEKIVFSYGYASGSPFPPGGSRVTIRLASQGAGTQLHLLHELPDVESRDAHVQGWRFQLSLFGNLVAGEIYAGATEVVDCWFAAWAIADPALRDQAFARIAIPGVRFRDQYSLLEGLADLSAHAGAAQRFMPGIRMAREGEVRQCQGLVLAKWGAAGSDGVVRMSGFNVFELEPGGRIVSATGFADPPAAA